MKKKLFMIFMAFTMVLAFAGCGSDEQDAETGGDVSMEAMEEETTTAAVEKEDPTGMQTIELEICVPISDGDTSNTPSITKPVL